MKKTKLILATSLAMTMLSSCGHKTVVRADENSGEDFINIDIDENAKPVEIPDLSANIEKIKNLGRDNKIIHQPPKSQTDQSPLDGEWIIIEVDNVKIDIEDEQPYVIFSDKDNRFYAFNGCNIINGTYKMSDKKCITFGTVVSTMKLCPDVEYETAISAVLTNNNTLSYRAEKKGNESYLYLTDSHKKKVMTLRRHNLEVLNGQWEVSEIEGEEVSGDVFNVFFDINQLLIHGNTGCNFFNGTIVIDPNVASSIGFTQMIVTQRACPNQETERQMLVALEETNTYLLLDDTLQLLDCDDHILMKLVRAK